MENVASGDITISKSYSYWGYAQEHDGEIVKESYYCVKPWLKQNIVRKTPNNTVIEGFYFWV